MLDGGCGSNIPLMSMGAEMTYHGDRMAFITMSEVVLDCGMPAAEWTDRELRIPVVEWMQRHRRQGVAVMPGSYRLNFRFADGLVRCTEAFRLD